MNEITIDKNAKQITFTNNGIGFSQFGIANEILDLIEQQRKEIERLNKENKILRENAEHNDKVVDKVNWENKRLNNIINELEKMMKNDLECACSMNENGLFNGAIDMLEVYLDKLQELKGSNKE